MHTGIPSTYSPSITAGAGGLPRGLGDSADFLWTDPTGKLGSRSQPSMELGTRYLVEAAECPQMAEGAISKDYSIPLQDGERLQRSNWPRVLQGIVDTPTPICCGQQLNGLG